MMREAVGAKVGGEGGRREGERESNDAHHP